MAPSNPPGQQVPMQQVNAWDKPGIFAGGPMMEMVEQVVSKYEKNDQHDSGIEVNEQPNSNASSRRSSPGNDTKIAKVNKVGF